MPIDPGLISDLVQRQKTAVAGGGAEKAARRRAEGRLSARERLVLLPYGVVYFSTLKCLCKLRQQIGMKRDATAFAGSDG